MLQARASGASGAVCAGGTRREGPAAKRKGPDLATRISPGEEDEVLDAAVAHAVAKHGHEESAELREGIRSGLVDAEPALA